MGWPKYLNKTVIIISLVSFFNDCSSELLYPIMPLYLLQLGAAPLGIGIIEGLAECVAAYIKLKCGWISDQTQRRLPPIIMGYSSSVIARGFLYLASNWVWVLFARCLDRLGKGLRSPSRDALLVDQSNEHNKGAIFGFHRSADTLGAVIGPIIALICLQQLNMNYKQIIGVAIFPGIIGVLLLVFIKEKPSKISQKVNWSWSASKQILLNSPREFKQTMLLFLCFGLFNASDAFIILRCQALGYDVATCLQCYLLFNISSVVLHYPIGILSDKVSKEKILFIGLLIFSISYLLFAQGSKIGITIALCLYGLFHACTDGVGKSLITKNISKASTANALGLFNAMQGLVFLLAGIITGLLFAFQHGAVAMFASGIGALIVAIVFYYRLKISSTTTSSL
jgi:MFS family permease